MNKFQTLTADLLANGLPKPDRTGVGTLSKFGYVERYDLEEGHPHETAKFTPFKHNVVELLWVVSGDTRLKVLADNNVHVWDDWVKPATAVWGEPYSNLQRGAIYQEMIDRGTISQEATEQYVSIWLEENKGQVMAGADVLAMFDHFRVPKAPLLDGDLGAVYGRQWRCITDTRRITLSEIAAYEKRGFKVIGTLEETGVPLGDNDYKAVIVERTIDQLQNVITQLLENPHDRGIIVNAWHVPDLDDMALRPCHTLFQFYTRQRPMLDVLQDILFADEENFYEWLDGEERTTARIMEFATTRSIATYYLDCLLYMRSNDVFLGRSFNISQYALLTRMVAQVVGMHPGEFILVNGDVHLYQNHKEKAELLLTQKSYPLPQVRINPDVKSINDFKLEDFELINYQHGGVIKAPVAV